MTTVITLTNQKGGACKTTAAVSIAAGLALRGFKTVLVDCDEQTNASQALGVNEEDLPKGQKTILDIFIAKQPASKVLMPLPDRLNGNLSLIPGTRMMSGLQIQLDAEIELKKASGELTELDTDAKRNANRQRLRDSLASLEGLAEYVVIDTPPALNMALTSSLIAADYYIIPVNGSAFDLKGLKRLQGTVKDVRSLFQPNLRLLGVLMTRVKGGTNIDEEVSAYLAQHFTPEQFFSAQIKDGVKHREAPFAGLTIQEHAPKDEASKQYMAVTDEALERVARKPLTGKPKEAATAPPAAERATGTEG